MDALIQKKIGEINEIPSLPIVATRVMGLMKDRDIDLKEISKVIMHDPALTLRIIRLANSAFYGLTTQVTSINHAVVMLGINTLYNIILGLSVIRSFRIGRSRWFDPDLFWQHCIACGLLSRKLSGHYKYAQPGTAFVCGLTHDIGRLIFVQFLHHEFIAASERAQATGCSLRQAEVEIIGFDHAATGAWLARRWGLPESLITGIEYHHNLPGIPEKSAEHAILVKLVAAANSICIQQDLGDSGETEVEVSPEDLVPQDYGINIKEFAEGANDEITQLMKLWFPE
jgi:putative nucleotidyltransferase with HDIG domain